MKQSFFAGTRYLGEAALPRVLRDRDNQVYRPQPIAFFCRVCGEVWGRVVPEGAGGVLWSVRQRACPEHAATTLWDSAAGQFAEPETHTPGQLTEQADWPVGVLAHDFEVVLQLYQHWQAERDEFAELTREDAA